MDKPLAFRLDGENPPAPKIEVLVTLRLRLPAEVCDVSSWEWATLLDLDDAEDARVVEVRSLSVSSPGES